MEAAIFDAVKAVFIKLIENNLNGIENGPCFGDYEEGVVMMMYDSVVIKKNDELIG